MPRAVSLHHRATGLGQVPETVGQVGLAEVEPDQNTKAKTKLVGNVIGSLIIKGR